MSALISFLFILALQATTIQSMSQRGSLTLFKNIFTDDSPAPIEKQKKGRSEYHNSRRNDCLVDRYLFYGMFSSWRYEKILKELSEEFFLSEVTIPKVIDENLDKLIELKKMKPEKSFFQNKWPHLVWP
jgi:hypothetical protein